LRHYTDAEKAEAIIRLAVNQYDFTKTAREIRLPVQTLRRWNKNVPNDVSNIPDVPNVTKKGVAELLEIAIEHLLMAIPDNFSGQQWAVTVGILLDKWLLMRGEPTQRTENLVKTFEALSNDDRRAIIGEAERIIAGFGTGDPDEGSPG